jgi:transcription antitermination factor NusG
MSQSSLAVTDGHEVYPARLPPPALVALPHPWLALRLRVHREYAVEDALGELGIETFLPFYGETVKWSDRTKETKRLLFPGYIFARLDPKNAPAILRLDGIVQVLPTSMSPEAIPEAQILNVQRALAAKGKAEPCPYVAGARVTIERGPLAGVQGVVMRTRGALRIVVAIELLRGAVSVEVDAADLAAAA